MSNSLRKIIRKVIFDCLNEAYATPHLKTRINQRVKGEYTFSSEEKSKKLGKKQFTTISDLENKKKQILFNLKFLEKIEFPLEGMAIKLFDFDGKKFVTHFYDEPEEEIGNLNVYVDEKKFKEEKGTTLWVIIRNNKMMTLHSTKGSKKPGNVDYYLDIDFIKKYIEEKGDYNLNIDDVNKIQKLEAKSKITQPIKVEVDPHLLIINIDGINYVADSNLEQVYKKNKQEERYNIYDFIDDLVEKSKGELKKNNFKRGGYFYRKSEEIMNHAFGKNNKNDDEDEEKEVESGEENK